MSEFTDTTALQPLTLTQIHYNPASTLSWLHAYMSLLPLALLISYASVLAVTREIELAFALLGQCGNEVVNLYLKRMIRQERPGVAKEIGGRGYGMPSSHAQFAGFWAAYWILFLLLRARRVVGPGLKGFVSSAGLLAVGFWIGWARVELGYHSWAQVSVGWAVGAVVAAGWYVATAAARKWRWAWETGMSIWEMVYGRDMMWQTDIVEEGYESWKALQRKNKGKKSE